MIDGYYNRHDPAKNFDRHLFRSGYVLQSAELNEVQSAAAERIRGVADALFKDGDVVRDARAVVDPATGSVFCESGAVYLRGAVRGVPEATISIPLTGSVAIGLWLLETVVTELEDSSLRDPAGLVRNYQEPGAARLKIEPRWGYQGDGTADAEFFPIYYADDGVLRAKEAPPALDSVSQAIANYDQDSNGSNYIVSGLSTTIGVDVDGAQVYHVSAGRARVNGFGVSLNTSKRVIYPAVAVLRYIDSEPFVSTTANAQRVKVDRTPIAGVDQVRITAKKTAALTHGTYSGALDPLPDSSVVDIVSVVQGATTYVKGTDYKLSSGRVDWSLSGAEPAAGSSYNVTYQYITAAEPTAVDETGFTVTGAVPGSLVLTSYNVKLPRIDRLVMNREGVLSWVEGVSTDYNPVPPQVPGSVIALCQVTQTWDSNRQLVNDGVRMVSMYDLESMSARMDQITALVAQQALRSDMSTRDAQAKKGLFVDPFIDDSQRDQGIVQTAAISNGLLTLPIDGDAFALPADVSAPAYCAFTLETVLAQTSRTGTMKINPYMAFAIVPALVALKPAVDRWTETVTQWASPITRRFVTTATQVRGGFFSRYQTTSSTSSSQTSTVSSGSQAIENLRSIEVEITASGFGAGEELASITFDGLTVEPIV